MGLRYLRFLYVKKEVESESERTGMHPLFTKADALTHEVIGAAIEVHRQMGTGLIESIYERCLMRELELRGVPTVSQKLVPVEYKDVSVEEPLRFDVLADDCLLLELKAVDKVPPIHKAKLLTYMKLLDIPLGLVINFNEMILKNGIYRMMLPNANR